MADLLGCPFCGNEPWSRNNSEEGPLIYCCSDECMGPHTTAATMQDAIVQWNTRPSSSAPVERREAAAYTREQAEDLVEQFTYEVDALANAPSHLQNKYSIDVAKARQALIDALLSLPGSSRDEVLEEAAEYLSSPVAGAELQRFFSNGDALTDRNGNDLFMAVSDVEKLLNERVASIRALKSGVVK